MVDGMQTISRNKDLSYLDGPNCYGNATGSEYFGSTACGLLLVSTGENLPSLKSRKDHKTADTVLGSLMAH